MGWWHDLQRRPSRGHYNPAVTMAAGPPSDRVRDAVAYWVAQVVSGVIAGLLARRGQPRVGQDAHLSVTQAAPPWWSADHLRPVLRDAQRGYQRGPAGRRLLRAGDRFHRRALRRRHFGGVFNGRRPRRRQQRPIRLVDDLDLPACRAGSQHRGGLAFLALSPGDSDPAGHGQQSQGRGHTDPRVHEGEKVHDKHAAQ